VRALLSIFRHLPRYLRLSWRLMRDPRVPRHLKWIVAGALIYTASPLDLIPDFTIVGLLEDFLVLLISVRNLVRMSPKPIVTEHAKAIAEGRPSGTPTDDGPGQPGGGDA
jgi:uncharacterized membrane protein YkvA (DUF1232 family)